MRNGLMNSLTEAFSVIEKHESPTRFLSQEVNCFSVSVLFSLKNVIETRKDSLLAFLEGDNENVQLVQVLSKFVYEDLIGPLDENFISDKQTINTLNLILGTILQSFLSEDLYLSTGLNLPQGCFLLQ